MRNRPRVFLSHSKSDEHFVSRLYNDLRECLIDPWYDSVDIRHGEPWLNAIFEGGIPTCDCVLVYLTEHSIESSMVKKEIDASLIQKLKDSRIGFLPYVSNASLRNKLRPDIQSLQIPEWNTENYNALFPRVVAEIWHIYYERAVVSATSEEKVKRLEAELQLDRLKEKQHEGIFTESEERDFKYIYSRLNNRQPVVYRKNVQLSGTDNKSFEELHYSVNILSLVQAAFDAGFHRYDDYYLNILLNEALKGILLKEDAEGIHCSEHPELTNDLLMYGFIQNITFTKTVRDSGFLLREPGYRTEIEIRYEFTPKVHRFRYWMAVNGFSYKSIDISPNKTMHTDAAAEDR